MADKNVAPNVEVNLDGGTIPLPTDFPAEAPIVEAAPQPKGPEGSPPASNTPIEKPKSISDLALSEASGEEAPVAAAPIEPEAPKPSDKQDNIAIMRKKAKTAEDALADANQRLEEMGETKLTAQQYKDQVDDLQGKIKTFETEVENLSKYRDVVDIKSSPKYREKYTVPMQQESNAIMATAKQYGITDAQVSEAMAQSNFAGMEKVLADHGMTSTGIVSVVNSVRNITQLKQQEAAASQDTSGFLKQLQDEQRNDRESVVNKISSIINDTSPVVWDGAVNSYREEATKGSFPTMQTTGNEVWDGAVKQADNIGMKVYSDTMADLESVIKHQTITPGIMNKIARMSLGYGHLLKDQKVYQAISDQNASLKAENARLRGDNPGHGGSPSKNTNRSKQGEGPMSISDLVASS